MAPNNTTAPPRAAVDMEIPVKWSSAQPPEYNKTGTAGSGGLKNHGLFDVVLRAVVFAAALAAVIVMVTSKQSKIIHLSPTMALPLDASWNQSPAYIYYVVAFLVACLYSIITGISSVLALKTGGRSTKMQFHVAMLDSFLLAIVSTGVGAALGVAWVGLKGNSHSFWKEICNAYGSFCHHLSASITMGLTATIALLLLVWLSFYSLSKKIAN